MSATDKYADIYVLSKHKDIMQSYDVSNILFISSEQACKKKLSLSSSKELVCTACHKETLLLWDSSVGAVCPPCMHHRLGDLRCCSICRKKPGCDSCGGILPDMVNVENSDGEVTLCMNNACLMPFGFRISFKFLSCTCEFDIVDLLTKKLPHPGICGIIRKMLISKYIHSYYNNSIICMPDLSIVKAYRCIPCQLRKKYKIIDDYRHVRAPICTCYNTPTLMQARDLEMTVDE